MNGQLAFEGEYLNGERNGKGKEYDDNGKLRFEGEYLNGERNGKGKEYDYDGKLRFEGEYLNEKRNGKEKEQKNNEKIKYQKDIYEESLIEIIKLLLEKYLSFFEKNNIKNENKFIQITSKFIFFL